jgi:hypothetical protein
MRRHKPPRTLRPFGKITEARRCEQVHRGSSRRGQASYRSATGRPIRLRAPETRAGNGGLAHRQASERPVPQLRIGPPASSITLASMMSGSLVAPSGPSAHFGIALSSCSFALAGRHDGAGLIRPTVLARFGLHWCRRKQTDREYPTAARVAPDRNAHPHGQNPRA